MDFKAMDAAALARWIREELMKPGRNVALLKEANEEVLGRLKPDSKGEYMQACMALRSSIAILKYSCCDAESGLPNCMRAFLAQLKPLPKGLSSDAFRTLLQTTSFALPLQQNAFQMVGHPSLWQLGMCSFSSLWWEAWNSKLQIVLSRAMSLCCRCRTVGQTRQKLQSLTLLLPVLLLLGTRTGAQASKTSSPAKSVHSSEYACLALPLRLHVDWPRGIACLCSSLIWKVVTSFQLSSNSFYVLLMMSQLPLFEQLGQKDSWQLNNRFNLSSWFWAW